MYSIIYITTITSSSSMVNR